MYTYYMICEEKYHRIIQGTISLHEVHQILYFVKLTSVLNETKDYFHPFPRYVQGQPLGEILLSFGTHSGEKVDCMM